MRFFVGVILIFIACFSSTSADILDGLPIISQFKSLVQVIGGDAEGAAATQRNFLNRAPVISQVKSAVHAIGGNAAEARRVQEEFAANQVAGTLVAGGLVADAFTAGIAGNGLINAGNEAAAMLETDKPVDWEKFATEGIVGGLIQGVPAALPILGDVAGQFLRNVYEKDALKKDDVKLDDDLLGAFIGGTIGFGAGRAVETIGVKQQIKEAIKKDVKQAIRDGVATGVDYAMYDIVANRFDHLSNKNDDSHDNAKQDL
jgi:hypothetical protein